MSTRPNLVTDETFAAAVAASFSVRETLRTLGLQPAGGNYRSSYLRIERCGLDTTHWTSHKTPEQGFRPPRSLEDILVQNSTYSSSNSLKHRLWKAGMLSKECCLCGISTWMGSNLVLQIDHINGERSDNRIGNLRILCPNCHSQTSTFGGSKLKKPAPRCPVCGGRIHKSSKTCIVCRSAKPKPICDCGSAKKRNSAKCRSCSTVIRAVRKTKIDWPDTVELLRQVNLASFVQVGKRLGVSDTAIRKHLISKGVDKSTLPDGRKPRNLSTT